MKYFFAVLAAVLAVMLSGCDDKDSFVITGTVAGAEAQSVTLTYYAGGGLKTVTAPMKGGQFRFTGKSVRPTLATLVIAVDNMRLADVVVKNGDVIKIEANLDDPYATKISGNSDSESVQRWLADNRDMLKGGNARQINQAIAEYVGKNRNKLSATALIVSNFRSNGFEAMADSLFSLLEPDVRTQEMTRNYNAVVSAYVGTSGEQIPFLTLYSRNDSLININPLRHSATLLCFVDADRRQRDSIVSVLRDLSGRYERSKLVSVELSTVADSADWRKSIASSDTVKWAQTWLPGSVASTPVRRLNVSRIPFFIVADSAGKTLYRGASVSEARRTVENHLN